MALEYIREYRTYFHISKSYGVSESTAYKTVRWVEDTLIKHPDFALPGRKALLKTDMEYQFWSKWLNGEINRERAGTGTGTGTGRGIVVSKEV